MKQPFKIIITDLEKLKIKRAEKMQAKKPVNNEIEKEFDNWLEKVFGDIELTEIQIGEMRQAFFCGGFIVLNKLVDFGTLPADIAETKFDNVLAEIETRVKGWAKDSTK